MYKYSCLFLLLLSLIKSRVFLFTIFLYVKEHIFLGHKCVLSIKNEVNNSLGFCGWGLKSECLIAQVTFSQFS